MSVAFDIGIIIAAALLIGAMVWAIGRISRKRGEERIGGERAEEQLENRERGDETRAEPLPLGERLVPAWRRYKRLREQDRK
jgi:hypothetical protein